MKIKRNNQEYELTLEEMRMAHDEYLQDCYGDDIMGMFEEMTTKEELSSLEVNYFNLSDAEMRIFEEEAVAMLEHNLGKSDAYYEAFWALVQDVVEQIAKKHSETELTFWELEKIFRLHENMKESDQSVKPLEAHILFTKDSFDKEYSQEARTYVVTSDNKRFHYKALGNSIFGTSLDNTDVNVRLDQYMQATGNKNGWKIEKINLIREESD